jgi:hypothetical protein
LKHINTLSGSFQTEVIGQRRDEAADAVRQFLSERFISSEPAYSFVSISSSMVQLTMRFHLKHYFN